jgi:Zn-finger nucleic acid-binding protein
MDCPTCRNAMITMELADVEIDHCTSCGGIWLDSGELELLMDNPAAAKRLLNSLRQDDSTWEQRRKCPICGKKMTKVRMGHTDPAVLVDKCQRGDGLWFDRGELQEVLSGAQLGEDNRIQRLLADMFGKDQENVHP